VALVDADVDGLRDARVGLDDGHVQPDRMTSFAMRFRNWKVPSGSSRSCTSMTLSRSPVSIRRWSSVRMMYGVSIAAVNRSLG